MYIYLNPDIKRFACFIRCTLFYLFNEKMKNENNEQQAH